LAADVAKAGPETHVWRGRLLGCLRCLGTVGHLLGVDAASPSAAAGRTATVSAGRDVGASGTAVRVVSAVHFVVVLWDHLVGDGLLVMFAEHLLEDADQGQHQCDGSQQQGFTGDQGDLTDGERKDGGEFDLQQGQQSQQNVLALLLCKKKNKRNGRKYDDNTLLRIVVHGER